jgi:hypothetical protein
LSVDFADEPVLEPAHTLIDHALAIAKSGHRVFPLKPRSKVPATEHGLKDATIDPETIRAWWTKTPDANIGLPTGAGFLVIDVDGQKGSDSLDQLERELGRLPGTYTVETASGRHIYLRASEWERIRNSAGKLGAGLDVRGKGGYVVGEGSIHKDGTRYTASDGLSLKRIGPLPDAWFERLVTKPKTAAPERAPMSATVELSAYAAKALDEECAAVGAAPKGTRNDRLNAAAFSLGQLCPHELGEALVADRLLEAAGRCGLVEDDGQTAALKTIRSGLESGLRHPRQPRDRPAAAPANSQSRARLREEPAAVPAAEARFRGLSHAEALKADVPDVIEIVQDVIEVGTLGSLAALPETYKSLLATELVHKIAAGGEQLVLGRLPVRIHGPVGYWWQDDSKSNELKRVQDYARRHGFTGALPITWHLNEGLRLPDDIPVLREEIDRLGQVLVWLDSLYNFLAPGVKLKDEDVAVILAQIKTDVCDQTGCTVGFNDHAPWPTEQNRGQGRGYGSVFKAAAIRWSIFLERAPGEENRVWVKAQGNNIVGLRKSLAVFDPDALELRLLDPDETAGVTGDEYEQRVLDYLLEHSWATTDEVDNNVTGRLQEVRKARQRLSEAGRLTSTPSAKLGRPGKGLRWNPSNEAASSPVPLFPDAPGHPVPKSVTNSQPRPPRPDPEGGTGLGADPPADAAGATPT